jgi:hypothetical protein
MSLSNEKKEFLKLISGGIQTMMSVSFQADEIGTKAYDDDEKYIKANLLSYKKSTIGVGRYWLSVVKFDRMIDTEDYDVLTSILFYLESTDNSLIDMVNEACLSDMNDVYAMKICDGDITTFKEFFDL